MIAQLLEILKALGSSALPCVVVDQWQSGVILRFGVFSRVLRPRFHWKIPFVESAVEHFTVVTTTSLSPQSVIAPDGKVYTAEGVVRWRVDDIKTYACDVWDSENVIVDSAMSAIADIIRSEGIHEVSGKVTTKSRRTLKKYGIHVEEVTLTTLAPIKCLRLVGVGQSLT